MTATENSLCDCLSRLSHFFNPRTMEVKLREALDKLIEYLKEESSYFNKGSLRYSL